MTKDPIRSLRLESCNKKSKVLCREIKYSIQKLLMHPSNNTYNEASGTLNTHTHTCTQSDTDIVSMGLVCSKVYYTIHFQVSRWWWQKAAVIARDAGRKDGNNIQ